MDGRGWGEGAFKTGKKTLRFPGKENVQMREFGMLMSRWREEMDEVFREIR